MVSYSIVLCCMVLCCILLYGIVLYCIVLYDIVLASEPQTRAGPLLPSSPPPLLPSSPPPPSRFLHRLQTSITRSIIKLKCFLRPFLKTRSHDESAHTFKSSLRFLEVPQKGVKKKYFVCIFLPHFLTRLVLSDPLKLFQNPGSWHECRPIYGLHFCIYRFFLSFIQKRGFWGSKIISSQVSGIFLAILAIKMADFLS